MQKFIKIVLLSSLAALSVYSFGPSAETIVNKKKPIAEKTSPTATAGSETKTSVDKSDAKITAIKSKLKAAYPDVNLDFIQESPVKGWFQAGAGNTVLYISDDAHHMMVGELLDLNLAEPDRNITENLRRNFRLKLLNGLNVKDMIVYPVKADKKKQATVIAFIDSDCGYCHKLHEEKDKLAEAGIELHYLAFPRAGVGSETYKHMVSAWCAEDRGKTFDALMKKEEIAQKECTNPVADQFLLGQKIGLTGTPTLLFEDGTLIPGYMPADKLAEEAIKHVKKSSTSQ
ncbi:MAG: hypothetical protein RLZ35_203 [Pseudomonadota bacterium]|jgi:thiol:disulfide interchange protein DsbC